MNEKKMVASAEQTANAWSNCRLFDLALKFNFCFVGPHEFLCQQATGQCQSVMSTVKHHLISVAVGWILLCSFDFSRYLLVDY